MIPEGQKTHERLLEQLKEFQRRFAPLFYEKRQVHWSQKWLHGLLMEGVRKTAASLARAVPGGDRQAMHHFIGESGWDHRAVIRELQAMVSEKIAHPEAILVVDETGFPKKGDKSVGVKRQYSGTLGKVGNCQIGVLCAYVSPKGRALVDEELYLPKEWASDKHRSKEAEVPTEVKFRTKPQLALQMIEGAAEGPLPVRWVACDDLYGQSGEFRDGVQELGLLFVAEVPSDTKVWTEMPPLAEPGPLERGRPRTKVRLSAEAPKAVQVRHLRDQIEQWQYVTVRKGSKKPIRSAWATLRVYPWRDGLPGRERWLLIERTGKDQHKYYLSNAPADTPLRDMARVAKEEWFVEQCFRNAKQQTGLDDYEVRKWKGWHHHITMCLLALWFLTLTQCEQKKRASS